MQKRDPDGNVAARGEAGESAIGKAPGERRDQPGRPRSAAGGWNYRDRMFGDGWGAASAPALATHAGKLWCLFVRKSDSRLYYAQGTNENWDTPKPFAGSPPRIGALRAPMLAELNGVLHAVFIEDFDNSHDLVHYQYDDVTGLWGKRQGLAQHSSMPVGLAAHNGRLFCAFVSDVDAHDVLYTNWDPEMGWNIQQPCHEKSGGRPGLFEWGGQLHLVFATDDGHRYIFDLVYDDKNDRWSRAASRPPEATAEGVGVSATSGINRGFMGFLENDAKSGSVYVSVYDYDGKWLNHEDLHQKSWEAPVVAVLNGMMNCAFISRNDARDPLWSQRQAVDVLPDSWMQHVAKTTKLSDLSLPGTHDSCAVSFIPFVETQTMAVVDQLNAGIRFLDLRCRLYDDVLWLYHGDYPLNPPWYMRLEDVLAEIYAWLAKHGTETVVAMIKEEGAPVQSVMPFDVAVADQVKKQPARWYTNDDTPTLETVGGKLVLMRRYDADLDPIGIDVHGWDAYDDSSRFELTTPGGVKVVVQDHYNLSSSTSLTDCVQKKWGDVKTVLDEAVSSPASGRWYMNYTSGFAASSALLVSPLALALGAMEDLAYKPGVNRQFRQYLTKRQTARYGTVIMDFPEAPDDLINAIIQSNLPALRTHPHKARSALE